MANEEVSTGRVTVNPDLQAERDKATFDITELTHILDGGQDRTERRRELEKRLFSDPTFQIKDSIYMSNSELYEAGIARAVKLFRLKRDENWSDEDVHLANSIIRDQNPLILHFAMFLPALESLSTDEQKAKWLPPARNFSILGAYAQTELGHGTNLMALETTATFDSATNEFVLRTPKLSSIKWWPGSLGKSANHAVVLAQLIINGKKHGMNAFIVQLRSMKDHSPMPGIKLGVIGPKMGGNAIDNGFLFLDNVRIPRENMLMKNEQVTRTGNYSTQGPDKANYATMVLVRVLICSWSHKALSTASTIAIRYSSVRRQSTLKQGTSEMKVLDYQTQQYKLFPALASSYAFFFIYKVLNEKYQSMLEEMQQGNSRNLPELHIWSSGMKALSSDLATAHIEICRRSCGGHGYLRSSGLPDVLCRATPLVTVEGENTVLYLQVARGAFPPLLAPFCGGGIEYFNDSDSYAGGSLMLLVGSPKPDRYLMKQIAKALSGQRVLGTTEYFGMNESAYVCPIVTEKDCRNLMFLCDVYKKRSYSIVLRVARQLQADIESCHSQEVAMNKNLQPLVKAAMAHCYVLAVTNLVQGISNQNTSQSLKKVLTDICCLFATYHITTNSGDFLETKALGREQLHWLQNQELQLLSEIRPNAIALVDAFDIHDDTLCSALGSYDGWAYERFYEAALKDPMNKTAVDPSYYKHLRQLMMEGTQSKL